MVNALKEMFSTVKPAVKFNIHVSSCIESYFGVKQRDSNSRLLFYHIHRRHYKRY